MNLDPSSGQATSHNTPAGPCSRLKASRSEHAQVSVLLLSTWPDILSCPGLVSCLVPCSIGAFLTKALPFHQPLGPSYHVAGPARGTDTSALVERPSYLSLSALLTMCTWRPHLYYLPGLCRVLPWLPLVYSFGLVDPSLQH